MTPVAVFTDGWAYHASPKHNRIADDSVKRDVLRANGYAVLGVTYEDLADGGAQALPLDWLTDTHVQAMMQLPAGHPGAGVTPDAVNVLRRGPLDVLLAYMERPHDAGRQALADAMWMPFVIGATTRVAPSPDVPATAVVRDLLLTGGCAKVAGSPHTTWWSHGSTGVLTAVDTSVGTAKEVVVTIDDSAAALAEDSHRRAWTRWLQVSNAFAWSHVPLTITATSLAESPQAARAPGQVAGREPVATALPGAWADLADLLVGGPLEARLVADLAAVDILPVPRYGAEVGDGIPVDFAWPDARVAVLLDPVADDVADLTDAGWLVVEPDAAAIAKAVSERTNA